MTQGTDPAESKQSKKRASPTLTVKLSSPRPNILFSTTPHISSNHLSQHLSKEAVEYIFMDWLESSSFKR